MKKGLLRIQQLFQSEKQAQEVQHQMHLTSQIIEFFFLIFSVPNSNVNLPVLLENAVVEGNIDNGEK